MRVTIIESRLLGVIWWRDYDTDLASLSMPNTLPDFQLEQGHRRGHLQIIIL